ncbi:DUF7504 family protein [Natronolimnohabitans innermongolicus]|uniref:Uncharacterized protein n=1 Tax=Natronolimnohabitans innermongolicus JCM 12255 TaxID=1227499 RepID=L9X2P6_9EURY|nr:hypothetical protein [Natronolimnohabitans innermongolicus]ELY55887.1 hypothetical protein C493_10428 [Natronolimnohabitans innermongolicus JCM 12255]
MDPVTPAEIDPPANVLLVHEHQCETDICESLCHGVDSSADLRVSFADKQPERPDPDCVPGHVGLLTVGDVLLEETPDSASDFDAPVVVDTVRDPTDLAAIGVAVSRFCKHWADEDLGVCFDSLDSLLRHTPPKTVFEFTYVLATRLSSVDAYAHFHFDPRHHEDRVVSTFGTIFDAVVAEEGSEGSVPEATDDEVAALLAEWSETDEDGAAATDDTGEFVFEQAMAAEATDEDVARLLGR